MSKKQKILSSNFWGENMTFKNLFQYLADLNSGSQDNCLRSLSYDDIQSNHSVQAISQDILITIFLCWLIKSITFGEMSHLNNEEKSNRNDRGTVSLSINTYWRVIELILVNIVTS